MRKLLSIEGVFAIEGRGLLLLRDFPWGPPARAEAAEIRRPDGTVVPVHLHVAAEHRSLTIEAARSGARAYARVCLIKGVSESDVIIGSELGVMTPLPQMCLATMRSRMLANKTLEPASAAAALAGSRSKALARSELGPSLNQSNQAPRLRDALKLRGCAMPADQSDARRPLATWLRGCATPAGCADA